MYIHGWLCVKLKQDIINFLQAYFAFENNLKANGAESETEEKRIFFKW